MVMLDSFSRFAENIIIKEGLTGIFAIALFESFIFPVPTAIIITAGTALDLDPTSVVIIATIGSVLGAIVGYGIGYKGGRPILEKLFSKDKIKKTESLFEKYGLFAVGTAAFTPLPFKIFTISAGIARMNLSGFILVTIPCRFAQFLLFALFGNFLASLF